MVRKSNVRVALCDQCYDTDKWNATVDKYGDPDGEKSGFSRFDNLVCGNCRNNYASYYWEK